MQSRSWAFREFDFDLQASKYHDSLMWEWVSPKAGILVHGESGVAPSKVSGINLFGNFTWGRQWKHGYEPLATLDVDGDGLLLGDELGDLWIWLDANSNAKLDAGEINPASEYVTQLKTRAAVIPSIGTGDNHVAAEGAKLKNGTLVSTWDWWSGSFYQGSSAEYIPQIYSDAPVTMYRWWQTNVNPEESLVASGLPPKIPEGYFRFGKVSFSNETGVMLAAISTAAPAELKFRTAWIKPYTHGGLEWTFGSVVTRAKLLPKGGLVGATYPGFGTDVPLYTWAAIPVTELENDYAASLAMFTLSELPVFADSSFRYLPLSKGDTPTPKAFLTLHQLLKSEFGKKAED